VIVGDVGFVVLSTIIPVTAPIENVVFGESTERPAHVSAPVEWTYNSVFATGPVQ
jgi:hypothetical protein